MNSKNNFDDRDTREGAPISIKAISLDDVIAEIAERRSEFNQRSHVPLDMIEKMKAVG
ncbi:flavin-dependent monooxygenase, partial [Pseudomonas sp. PA-5-4B]|nr:flavin-dependent monooxygenase [Pseudomonas sp. PA-5-4B]